MKTKRLFHIIYSLLEKKCMTVLELAENRSVSVRTVYRDVEALSMAGVYLLYSRKRRRNLFNAWFYHR